MNKPRVSYHSPRSTAGSGTGIIKGGFFMVVAIGVGYAVYKYLGFRDYLLDRKSRRMEVTVQKYLAMQEKSDTRCKCTGSWCECENKARARLVEQYRQQQEQTQPASTTPAL